MTEQKFSKYERARIIGARGLQISMDAPLLMKMDKSELDSMNFDPLKIAEKELDSGILPISINKPMPQRKEDDIKDIKIDQSVPSDKEKIKKEKEDELEVIESGNIVSVDDSGEDDEKNN